MGAVRGQAARSGRPWQQARARPAEPVRSDARSVRARRASRSTSPRNWCCPPRPSTPIAEIEALVAERGQQLDFEPMDYGAILGLEAGTGSLGGALAANLSGPRRIKAGAARAIISSACLAVSGRGEAFKSGGRVVKNVTGYDLCKLIAGSWGTLAAMVDVTIKTLPKPETEETVVVAGLDDARAAQAMAAAMGSSCDVSAAAHLPKNVVMRFDGIHAVEGATVFRLEGVAPSSAPSQDGAGRVVEAVRSGRSRRRKRIRARCGGACATPSRSGRARHRATGRCGASPPRRPAAMSLRRCCRTTRNGSLTGPAV